MGQFASVRMAPQSQAFPPRGRASTTPKPVMAKPGSIPIAFTKRISPDVKKPPNHFPLEGVAYELIEIGMFTLLLHKGKFESAVYHHKKAVSTPLMILFKGHYLGDPVDYVDLAAVPLWSRL